MEAYNILDRKIENDKILYAQRYNLGLLAYIPLDQGILAGKYLKNYGKGSRITYYSGLQNEIDRTLNTELKFGKHAQSIVPSTPINAAVLLLNITPWF